MPSIIYIFASVLFLSGCSASVDKDKSGDITRVTAENASLVQQQATQRARVEFCWSLTEEQKNEGCQEETNKKQCARNMFRNCLKGT